MPKFFNLSTRRSDFFRFSQTAEAPERAAHLSELSVFVNTSFRRLVGPFRCKPQPAAEGRRIMRLFFGFGKSFFQNECRY
jgi:hypothetical protein